MQCEENQAQTSTCWLVITFVDIFHDRETIKIESKFTISLSGSRIIWKETIEIFQGFWNVGVLNCVDSYTTLSAYLKNIELDSLNREI